MSLTTYKTAASSDAAAITRLLMGLRELGWAVHRVHDGENGHTILDYTPVSQVVPLVTAVDEAHVYLTKRPHGPKATMFFVMGNEPYEVMNDCSSFDEWNADLKAVEEAVNLEGV